jgi:hypothetical protein
MVDLAVIENEKKWRRDLLNELGGRPANFAIEPALLRDWGIYGGQQGVWIDKKRTVSLSEDGNGFAVGLLHKGNTYPDDFDETGVIYHYPDTNRPRSRDIGEIEAVKNCFRWQVPVFVITVSTQNPSLRDVYFGYITLWDDKAKVFIVEFGLDAEVAAHTTTSEASFNLKVQEPKISYEATRRPGQAAFRIAVFRRYGIRCAVCDMSVIDLLDAAHLASKAQQGSDDPRNGLPLCALHHRAFDKKLFAIEPSTHRIVTKPTGPSAMELGITKLDLQHLNARPHSEALDYCWAVWLKDIGV